MCVCVCVLEYDYFISGPVPGKQLTNMTVNFGPQHPAAHGVLRLVLELNGEVRDGKEREEGGREGVVSVHILLCLLLDSGTM